MKRIVTVLALLVGGCYHDVDAVFDNDRAPGYTGAVYVGGPKLILEDEQLDVEMIDDCDQERYECSVEDSE